MKKLINSGLPEWQKSGGADPGNLEIWHLENGKINKILVRGGRKNTLAQGKKCQKWEKNDPPELK